MAVEAAAPGPARRCLRLDPEPTETATAAAFAHTADLAGQPGNAAALAKGQGCSAGSRIWWTRGGGGSQPPTGRTARGKSAARHEKYGPGRGPQAVRRRAAPASGSPSARPSSATGRLVHALLVHELTRSVHRVFAGVARASAPGAAEGSGAVAMAGWAGPAEGSGEAAVAGWAGAAESGDAAGAADGHAHGARGAACRSGRPGGGLPPCRGWDLAVPPARLLLRVLARTAAAESS